jgi:hypothetical protein
VHSDEDYFCIFRDHITGLEYIRSSKDLNDRGLYVELDAYKCHVFLDWREVQDNEWHQYAHLTAYLDGHGVPSIDEALREIFLQPIHEAFKEIVNAGLFRRLIAARVTESDRQLDKELVDQVEQKMLHLLREIKQITHSDGDEVVIAQDIRRKVEAVLQLPILQSRFPWPNSRKYASAVKYLKVNLDGDPSVWGSMFGWCFVHSLGKALHGADWEQQSRSWIDEWLLGKIMASVLQDLGLDEAAAWRAVAVVKSLTAHQRWFDVQAPKKKRTYQVLESALNDGEVQQLLQVNRYQGILWFNKEAFERWLWWMSSLAAVEISATRPTTEVAQELVEQYDVVAKLLKAEKESGYQVGKLVEAASSESHKGRKSIKANRKS